ncbi:MAG: radical SAM protein [Candidatus Brockarchaeota archaeon]|nr:radical SAM protein [Candidatus Brockarchaeota archaeon]
MAVTGIHLLLTYQCNFECDHCFVWGKHDAKGVMALSDVGVILSEAAKLGTVERIYFEGGEPFLYYPIMLKGLEKAAEMGFKTGMVTNGYWATSIEDAIEWLVPIAKTGVADLTVSEDAFHCARGDERPKNAVAAARKLGMQAGTIVTEDPRERLKDVGRGGKPSGGAVMFRGRAVEKLVEGLPRRPWEEFSKCLDEDFLNQSRVHVDPFGYVHVCQGLTIGNWKDEPLSELIRGFDPRSHPICGPILEGGPAGLVNRYGLPHEESYVDECHLCYSSRLALRERFPKYLAPDHVYGIG